jgi:molybdopterin-guanine dinucleotide biosynthesis protein B
MSLDALIGLVTDVDLILTEGYRSADRPKIEVFRKGLHPDTLCGPTDNLIALVTDADLDMGCPRFGLGDIEPLADFILARLREE